MNAVVFTDSAVISFVMDNFVPVRVMTDDPLSRQFYIKWTPSLLILDSKGKEHYRTLGFYPPQDLIPSLLLGKGKVFFNQSNRTSAIDCFNRIVTDYPALIIRSIGAGRIIWSAASFESDDRTAYKKLLMSLAFSLVPRGTLSLVTTASKKVELVTFDTGNVFICHTAY
jgi:hypothetical protein